MLEEALKSLLGEHSSVKLKRWNEDWIITLSLQNGKRTIHVKGESLIKELNYILKLKQAGEPVKGQGEGEGKMIKVFKKDDGYWIEFSSKTSTCKALVHYSKLLNHPHSDLGDCVTNEAIKQALEEASRD